MLSRLLFLFLLVNAVACQPTLTDEPGTTPDFWGSAEATLNGHPWEARARSVRSTHTPVTYYLNLDQFDEANSLQGELSFAGIPGAVGSYPLSPRIPEQSHLIPTATLVLVGDADHPNHHYRLLEGDEYDDHLTVTDFDPEQERFEADFQASFVLAEACPGAPDTLVFRAGQLVAAEGN